MTSSSPDRADRTKCRIANAVSLVLTDSTTLLRRNLLCMRRYASMTGVVAVMAASVSSVAIYW
jgi:hypothetical protein